MVSCLSCLRTVLVRCLGVEALPVRVGQVWKRQIGIGSPLPCDLLVVTCWTGKDSGSHSYCRPSEQR